MSVLRTCRHVRARGFRRHPSAGTPAGQYRRPHGPRRSLLEPRGPGALPEARSLDFYRRALDDFDSALSENPEYGPARSRRGRVFARIGEALEARDVDPRPSYERAIADCSEIIRREPRTLGSYLNRGIAYARRGKAEAKRGFDFRPSYELAIADFDRSLECNPTHWQPSLNKGLLLEELGRFAESAAAYEAGMKVHPRPAKLQPLLERARKNR